MYSSHQNVYVLPKCIVLTKMYISYQNVYFSPKCIFLTKMYAPLFVVAWFKPNVWRWHILWLIMRHHLSPELNRTRKHLIKYPWISCYSENANNIPNIVALIDCHNEVCKTKYKMLLGPTQKIIGKTITKTRRQQWHFWKHHQIAGPDNWCWLLKKLLCQAGQFCYFALFMRLAYWVAGWSDYTTLPKSIKPPAIWTNTFCELNK